MSEEISSPPVDVVSPSTTEERLYASACHFAGLPIFTAIALANILAPLVIWLIKRDTMPFVDEHGKESLNFQITALLAYVVAIVTACAGIGIALIAVVAVLQIIFPIIGGIAAYEGKSYKYPVTLRLIK